jgi:hypothetical protein
MQLSFYERSITKSTATFMWVINGDLQRSEQINNTKAEEGEMVRVILHGRYEEQRLDKAILTWGIYWLVLLCTAPTKGFANRRANVSQTKTAAVSSVI